jgi:putative ribosome biogenesis GTPase RsgA
MTARPYKGLESFADTELDAQLFFGRDRERDTLVANVLASRLTVVYGPSGVGKSSLLRAGVAQGLRAQELATVVVHDTWAERPIEALVEAVR